jgi:2-oxo-3-hexenedioate decarboxylase
VWSRSIRHRGLDQCVDHPVPTARLLYKSAMPEIGEAFEQQLQCLDARLAAGMPRLGWKVGINVPEVQRKLGLTHALVGWLDGERCYASGDAVPVPTQAKLHVEVELCVRLGSAPDPHADEASLLSAVDAIAPALELVDYAIPAADLAGVVRSSMFHHGCVVGRWQQPRADIAIASAVTLRVDDVRAEAARPELVPGQLAELVRLVALQLSAAGRSLQAGDRILSGCFVSKALPLRAGQTAVAELGAFGEVRCTASSHES